MSGIQLQFDASPLFDDLAKMADPRLVGAATRAIGVYMIGEVQKHFHGQTLWDDSPMPPSNPRMTWYEDRVSKKSGKAYRKKLKQRVEDSSHKTLIDKGHLRDSYTWRASGAIVELGSDLIYAPIHHAGGDAGRNHASHIDPRPVLGVNPRNENDIIDEITKVFMGSIT